MVSKNLLERVIAEDAMPIELAEEYLKLYIADVEWSEHIQKLWGNFYNKNKNEEQSVVLYFCLAWTTLRYQILLILYCFGAQLGLNSTSVIGLNYLKK